MQRSTRQPHVGTGVRIRLGATRMIQPPHETQLVAKRLQWSSRLVELKVLARLGGKPMPVLDFVCSFGQRHAVGRIHGAESLRQFFCNVSPHRIKYGQSH